MPMTSSFMTLYVWLIGSHCIERSFICLSLTLEVIKEFHMSIKRKETKRWALLASVLWSVELELTLCSHRHLRFWSLVQPNQLVTAHYTSITDRAGQISKKELLFQGLSESWPWMHWFFWYYNLWVQFWGNEVLEDAPHSGDHSKYYLGGRHWNIPIPLDFVPLGYPWCGTLWQIREKWCN